MAAANKRVIVVIASGGAVDMNLWIDRIPALLEAWYPGQEAALPSPRSFLEASTPPAACPSASSPREDNPVHDSYYPEPGSTRVVYKEGMFVGYRGYEYKNVKTRFEFGSGLSYSAFRYRSLLPADLGYFRSDSSESAARLRSALRSILDVTNTSSRAGATVAEVYVGESHPSIPSPLKELKGFARVNLRPGETRHVTIPLNSRAFSSYDVSAHAWRVNPGEFTVYVGQSVDQLELKKAFIVTPSTAESATSAP